MAAIYTEIYKVVQSIPKGKVLTYGLISQMIGRRMSAQGVGWALNALGGAQQSKRLPKKSPIKGMYDMNTVPWQRVVNAQGGTSTHKVAEVPPHLQQHLLEAEGVVFNSEGKMDLKKYLWTEGLGKELADKAE